MKVIWTSEKGIISLVNAREIIQTLKKETISLVTRESGSLGNRTSLHHSEREANAHIPIWSEATSGSPKAKLPISAKLPRSAKLHGSGLSIPQQTYSSLSVRLKAKLNLTTKATFTFTYHQSEQFKVFQNLNHSIADSRKLWRGSCWHSKKTELPHSSSAGLNNV